MKTCILLVPIEFRSKSRRLSGLRSTVCAYKFSVQLALTISFSSSFNQAISTMHLAKFLSAILISSALVFYGMYEKNLNKDLSNPIHNLFVAQGRRLDDFSSEDDSINEINIEDGRKIILPLVDRLFNSAETQTKIKVVKNRPTKIKRENDAGEESTKSSKHAHSMITSMLSFVSSVVNFGRTMMGRE